MKPSVLIGHGYGCPIHGEGTVETGASASLVDGRTMARVGGRIMRGAIIKTGDPATLIESQPVARKGDKTSHGGTLTEGDPSWLID